MTDADPALETVRLTREDHRLLIGINRPEKRNSFTLRLIDELALAYGLLEHDPDLRCGVVYGEGEHFTTGLDLSDVADAFKGGQRDIPADGRDPWRLDGSWTTPVIAVAHGWCMTAGIELLLAADIRLAAADARFTQFEVRRGIYPFGGATLRFPRETGWGNAMRWILTGDEFGADEALRIGLVQEVAPDRQSALDRARAIAATIAEDAAPLGVQAILRSAQTAVTSGEEAAAQRLVPDASALFATDDAAEGLTSFIERRAARFVGR
jgi:enoyl-CoA hydratase/carnithine racemase